MTANQQKRIALRKYQEHRRSNAFSLSDVYGSFSKAKADAWKHCERLMRELNGWHLRVISHNSNIFTAGFLYTDEHGVINFMYITPTYEIGVEVP